VTRPDTKELILDAAEAVFAERGYAEASMRSITRAAGVNLAAVHYHFGSKVGLFQAVLERRVGDLNAERLRLLDETEARHGRPAPLAEVLEALIGPPLRRCASGDEGWARFTRVMGRAMAEPGEQMAALREVFREVQQRFFPALQAGLPHLEEADFFWRLNFLMGSMCHHMTDPLRVRLLSDGRCDPENPEEGLRQLLAFAIGGFLAPSAARPAATPRTGRAP